MVNLTPRLLEESVLGNAIQIIRKKYYQCRRNIFIQKGTQTIIRDNDCQTLPWEPPYTIKPGHDPELLHLINLTWGHGLPAGMHEIEMINRMRMRRAWEQILPPMDTPANIKLRSKFLSALEADNWAFRDAEIQFLMDLRIELAQKIMLSVEKIRNEQSERRFKKLKRQLTLRKQQEIRKIRNRFSRELRKLSIKYQADSIRQNKKDVVQCYIDETKCYVHSKPRYDCSKTLREIPSISDLNIDDKLTSLESEIDLKPNYLVSIPKDTKICPRIKKRNEKKLLELERNLELLKVRLELPETCTLLKRKEKVPSLPPTPSTNTSIESFEEEQNLYSRSVEELQSVYSETDEDKLERLRQLDEERKALQENRIKEILSAVEGKIISRTLITLNEKLEELQNEKKAHALALLAEKERVKRELAQATKEQEEIIRRRELDEIFRQITKVNQESVETYLEDIVEESIEWVSEKEAKKYIEELADKMDAMEKYITESGNKIDEEGIISDLVYNFVIPEVEKESTRQKLRERQKSYLIAAHDSIYDEILNLPIDELLSDVNTSFEMISETPLNKTDGNIIIGITKRILTFVEISNEKYKEEVSEILQYLLERAYEGS